MEPQKARRHLAAILFTDIEGYTAMMQRDETEALAAVRKHNEVCESLIPQFGGEIYQFYGDGCLSIFPSSNDAVKCALECQKIFLEEPIVPLRMGIHIGEIYHDSNRIYGDGVNIASRIESIGQAGTVLFSNQVYDKIRNNRDFQIEFLGAYDFKNVDKPIEVYALSNPEINFPDRSRISGKLKSSSASRHPLLQYWWSAVIVVLILSFAGFFLVKPGALQSDANTQKLRSIAVLPFSTSENPGDSLFGFGMAEEILTHLSKIKDLKVISRSSSFQFANNPQPTKKIANELGVSTILKGSVRKYDNTLRISVQLINPEDDSYIWAEQYDGEISEILKLQRDVALSISGALKIELSPELKARMDQAQTIHTDAYEHYQKGQAMLKQSSGTKADIEQAIAEFEEAISIDSSFSLAWTGLADSYLEAIFWHRMEENVAIPKAREAAIKALQINPNIGECYGVLGAIDLYLNNLGLAERNLNRAIELSPNYSFGHERLAWINLFKDNPEGYWREMEIVNALDPLSTRYKGSVAYGYSVTGKCAEGIQKLTGFLRQFPDDNFLLWNLGFLHICNEDYRKAIEVFESRTIGTHTNWLLGYAYARSGNIEKAQEILDHHLEKAESTYVPNYMIAVQYMGLDNYDKALEYLEYGIHTPGESYFIHTVDSSPIWAELDGNPEFERLMKEFNSQLKF